MKAILYQILTAKVQGISWGYIPFGDQCYKNDCTKEMSKDIRIYIPVGLGEDQAKWKTRGRTFVFPSEARAKQFSRGFYHAA